jgi:integrase
MARMASVHRRPRSPFWFVAYTDALGRRVRKSSKTRDRGEALRLALQLERAGRLGREDNLFENRARSLLSELMGQVTEGRASVRAPSIWKFLEEWIETKSGLVAPSTLSSLRTSVGQFKEHLGARADRQLASLTTRDLQGWVGALKLSGVSPGTIGLRVKTIREALGTAVHQQLLLSNPAALVELPRGFPAERGVFTPGEVGVLVGAAPGEWKTAILTAFYTGARLLDVTSVRWADVNLVDATLTFHVRKLRGKPLTVPIHPALAKHFEEQAAVDTAQTYLMPHLANRSTGGGGGLSTQFKAIAEKAGIDLGVAEHAGKNRLTKRSFHALRHAFTSALLNAGVEEPVRMMLTGHTSKGSHRRYAHATPETLAQAIAKLPVVPGVAS